MTEASAIVVVGEALIDIVEEAGAVGEHVGGSPANVALGLGRMGERVAMATQVGGDDRGARIVAHLTEAGVQVLPSSVTTSPTSTARARIGRDGHAEYEFDVRWNPVLPATAYAAVIHTGSVAAFLEPGAGRVRRVLARADAREITFDPNIRPALVGDRRAAVAAFEEIAALATVVKMSDEDAAWLYPGTDLAAVMSSVRERGPRLVIMTRGEHGADLVAPGAHVHVPSARVDVVDTIGAGDTFMAAVVAFVARHGSRGLDAEALRKLGAAAARAAAITVSRRGADLPWADELD